MSNLKPSLAAASILLLCVTSTVLAPPDRPAGRNETIFTAATRGDIDLVRAMLDAGADPLDTAGSYGMTALDGSILSGRVELYELLLSRLKDINAPAEPRSGITPLMLTIQQGKVQFVQAALKAGAKPNVRDADLRTALHVAVTAALKPDVLTAIVRVLLDAGADPTLRDGRGATPLDYAAGKGNMAALEALCQAGAPVTPAKGSLSTAVHLAAEGGHANAIAWLLAHKADVNAKDVHGETALHAAAARNHVGAAQALVECGADINAMPRGSIYGTPLAVAAGCGAIDVACLLIEHRAEIDAVSDGGFTPLHAAALNGHVAMVRLLLEKGAAFVNTPQGTPLHTTRSVEVAKIFLVEKGVHPEAPSPTKATPLHAMSMFNQVPIAELLMDRGADPNRLGARNETALFAASANGHAEMVRLLLKRGASANVCNESGETPLHVLAVNDVAAVAELLLEFGADTTARDSKGRTALDRAKERKLGAVEKILTQPRPERKAL